MQYERGRHHQKCVRAPIERETSTPIVLPWRKAFYVKALSQKSLVQEPSFGQTKDDHEGEGSAA
jgi:hypothetical protein